MASAVFHYRSSLPISWREKSKDASGAEAGGFRFEDLKRDHGARVLGGNATTTVFEGMVGSSRALAQVLDQVRSVAATDSTVLLQGETGTGKELISRALHNLSKRRNRNFVKFNCAAIPPGLLESELFGHERGAFTGAVTRKVGRFELADKGTLFLDEIGEIPPEIQVKLLRVLQEQEFEKLGSTQTQRVNVRFVAATNRDLAEMVSEGEFRSDLYFRLNVFPITVPALRERPEDIPVLTEFFVQQFARRMEKRIETIPTATVNQLQQYAWPGNIRELQNFLERAVILTNGETLGAPLQDLKMNVGTDPSAVTLNEAESSHILKTLRETNWVLGGPRGAAMRLGVKRTTLISKMRRLGLSRPAPGLPV
jgi:formate hydrogenlyase transcriptional activator